MSDCGPIDCLGRTVDLHEDDFYAEGEDFDEDNQRRGPCVGIGRVGGDGTSIEVYGTSIENARKLAGVVLDCLNSRGGAT